MKTLITGGVGFVDTRLNAECVKQGHGGVVSSPLRLLPYIKDETVCNIARASGAELIVMSVRTCDYVKRAIAGIGYGEAGTIIDQVGYERIEANVTDGFPAEDIRHALADIAKGVGIIEMGPSSIRA